MTFRKFTRSEINRGLAEVYYAFAGGLKSINHPMAKVMAWSAFFFDRNIGFLGRVLFWVADSRITKQDWTDLAIMQKFKRLDKVTGQSMVCSHNKRL